MSKFHNARVGREVHRQLPAPESSYGALIRYVAPAPSYTPLERRFIAQSEKISNENIRGLTLIRERVLQDLERMARIVERGPRHKAPESRQEPRHADAPSQYSSEGQAAQERYFQECRDAGNAERRAAGHAELPQNYWPRHPVYGAATEEEQKKRRLDAYIATVEIEDAERLARGEPPRPYWHWDDYLISHPIAGWERYFKIPDGVPRPKIHPSVPRPTGTKTGQKPDQSPRPRSDTNSSFLPTVDPTVAASLIYRSRFARTLYREQCRENSRAQSASLFCNRLIEHQFPMKNFSEMDFGPVMSRNFHVKKSYHNPEEVYE